MKLYHIRGWSELFENNRSRTVKELSWVAIPNRHDGENFSGLITHKDGAIIFAAWVLIVQVASRCQPRGTLLRDNKTPHSPASLSLKTRAPEKWFEIALAYLEKHTDWLETEEISFDCQEGVSVLSASCQSGDEEQKGTEGNGTGQKNTEGKALRDAKAVLQFLNEASGRKFRETSTNLEFITARFAEPEVTLDGVKLMIERQVKRWKGTAQEEYLRPETLFNKTKFDGYYAAKHLPVTEQGVPSAGIPVNGAQTVVLGKELERVELRIRQLRQDYADHQTWSGADRERLRTLKEQRTGLRQKLGLEQPQPATA